MAARFSWKAINRGDEIPHGAILGGRTSKDGEVFVGRHGGELGKLNTDNEKMYNIWCHNGGASSEGEILIVTDGAPIQWVPVKKGDALPPDAVNGGSTSTDGDIYPCRKADGGAVGKLNLKDSKINSLWFHGDWFAKSDGDILVVGPVGADESWAKQFQHASGGEAHGMGAWIKDHKGALAIAGGIAAAGAAAAGVAYAAGAFDGKKDEPVTPADSSAGPGASPAPAAGYAPTQPAEAPIDETHPHHHDPARYDADAMCDGIKASERVNWLEKEKGMSHDDAVKEILQEFPKVFWWHPNWMCDGSKAKDRAKWLMDNKGLSQQDARLQVRNEFPQVFGFALASSGGDFVDGKFPHRLQLVKTADGHKLMFAVTPRHPKRTSLVAVHYEISPGNQSMNFDVNAPERGTHTYVHVTPNGGGYPSCPPGSKVKYWLAAKVDGLIETQGEPHHERLHWTAHE